jgi:hypothetical protein
MKRPPFASLLRTTLDRRGPYTRIGRARQRLSVGLCILVLVGTPACGSDDKTAPDTQTAPIDLVDPSGMPYGNTYAGWSAGWMQYAMSYKPPGCENPYLDETGGNCRLYQDPQSPVFYLSGNLGGVSVRDECVAPAGKALFFPVVIAFADNAGVPADMWVSDDGLKSYVEAMYTATYVDSLHVSVDGHAIGDLERGGVMSAPYTVDFASDGNAYTCSMVDGVEGPYSGYIGGYWAMLPPLSKGRHEIAFGGSSSDPTQSNVLVIDVTYSLTVE